MARAKGKVLVNVEMWPEDRERIRDYAGKHGLTMADYVRMRTLNPIEVCTCGKCSC